MASPWPLIFSSGERPRALWALLFIVWVENIALVLACFRSTGRSSTQKTFSWKTSSLTGHFTFCSLPLSTTCRRVKRWFLDGTFKAVSRPFYQLMSVNAFIKKDAGIKQLLLLFVRLNVQTTETRLRDCVPGKPPVDATWPHSLPANAHLTSPAITAP